MSLLLLTGASGYIGAAVAARARAAGWQVVALGRRGDGAMGWSLGQPLPTAALALRPDALIHLAHDWADDAQGGNRNLEGWRTLLESWRAAGLAGRVVLASTVSARADAVNRYGRIKFAMEQALSRPGEVAARICLVYGGPPRAQWGSLCRLAGLPLLPMVAPATKVQPIHRDEVADGLLALAAGRGGAAAMAGLGGAPLAFGAFLKTIARQRHGGDVRLLPVPLAAALLAARLLIRLRLAGPPLLERLNGLGGLTTLECRSDLAALGLTLADPAPRIAAESRRRRLAAEGRRLLSSLGLPRPGPAVVARYVRLAETRTLAPLALPRLLPLRLLDPGGLPGAAAHPLTPRLEMALRLLEAPGIASPLYDYAGQGRARALFGLAGTGLMEMLLLPVRLILSRWRR